MHHLLAPVFAGALMALFANPVLALATPAGSSLHHHHRRSPATNVTLPPDTNTCEDPDFRWQFVSRKACIQAMNQIPSIATRGTFHRGDEADMWQLPRAFNSAGPTGDCKIMVDIAEGGLSTLEGSWEVVREGVLKQLDFCKPYLKIFGWNGLRAPGRGVFSGFDIEIAKRHVRGDDGGDGDGDGEDDGVWMA